MLKNVFSSKTNEQRVREWTRQLRSEQRKIDMQISRIGRDEQKLKLSLKQAARKGDNVAMRMIAKELVRSHKAVNRMYTTKSQMNSVCMQLQNQIAQMKVVGSLGKSGEVMKEMNQLMKIGTVNRTVQEMSREMMKAGLIDETINDTLDDALDEDISDAELEEAVNKVVDEAMLNKFQGTAIHTGALPQPVQEQEAVEDDAEDEALKARLAALRDV